MSIEDVELIREYVSQAATNQGIVGGFSNLNSLKHSLQWKARGVPKGTTTLKAGLGYVDDRPGRTVDRYVGVTPDQPLVGDKETDMRIVDTLSNLFPWLVDRKSMKKYWYASHMNGRNFGPERESLPFQKLYTAAWIVAYSSAGIYYPPGISFSGGHPWTPGDVVGGDFETHDLPFTEPNLPENNPSRKAFFRDPYPDLGRPGLSFITAMAPIYFTGVIGNYSYNDTYLASTGLDIAVDSTSALLDELLDTMTESSFAIIVDIEFHTIVISQSVVNRLYPPMTGFEESRVTFNLVDGSIIEDRRNQTYTVSDTIHQGLTKLDNADWLTLWRQVKQTRRGERSYSTINITLTGDNLPKEFLVMYERWNTVADWIMLAFAPKLNVENAIRVEIYEKSIQRNETIVNLQGERGHTLNGEAVIINSGTLDVKVRKASSPAWLQLDPTSLKEFVLIAGETASIVFSANTSGLEIGKSASHLTFAIQDDNYPDCFYNQDITLFLRIEVLPKDCVNLTGDRLRIADEHENCICLPLTIEIGNTCYHYPTLLLYFIFAILLFIAIYTIVYVELIRRKSESYWSIKSSELTFDDDPVILGSGTFGLVLKAEYRGTQVAVKRVIPPNGNIPQGCFHQIYQRCLKRDIKLSYETSINVNVNKNIDFDDEKPAWPKLLNKVKWTNYQSISSEGSYDGILTLYDTNYNDSNRYQQLKKDFILEMKILSKLRHPCITTVMGAVISFGEEPLLVMELMDHGSLFDLIHNETMIIEGETVLPILQDIAQGLRFLHAASPQVIHGDLKALNVLVDRNLRAKVADFGLSQKRNYGASGTPFWMAPEILRCESRPTTASDVYSFGIILFELYAREIPYQGDTDYRQTIKDICDPSINKRPPVPASMPAEVEALMTCCTYSQSHLRPTFDNIDKTLRLFGISNVEPKELYFSLQSKKSEGIMRKDDAQRLLLTIFPTDVANALSNGQKVEPQYFDCVTVYFSEITDFTGITARISPLKVSDLLDRLYNKLDLLSMTHQIFKVETVGDTWMGVTNLVSTQLDHTARIAAFALDTIKVARETLIDESDISQGYISIRVGFHSGPVIGNVVGSRNPKYTLIGDTVNTSSRMKSYSRSSRILCSSTAAKLLTLQSSEFSLEPREPIEVKGKGVMDTFWVTRNTISANN